MSERTKILNFLLEDGCEIIHFESYDSLRVHFRKGKAPMQIVLDNVNFIEFKKTFEELWASVPELYRIVEN
jgi:hypothetical protein